MTSQGEGNSTVQEDPQINPKIQDSLDLWRRIRDYDKENAAAPFVPVLSKKQQQKVKRQFQIGKPSFTTRSRGAPTQDNQ